MHRSGSCGDLMSGSSRPLVLDGQQPPLIHETALHKALKVYDNVKMPQNMTIVLKTSVFDGVGDLEHITHAARHLLNLRKIEPFRLFVFLERHEKVSETAWKAKLAVLSQLGLDGLYCCGREIPIELSQTAQKAARMMQSQISPLCIMNISAPGNSAFMDHTGSISEYGMGYVDRAYMDVLPSGLASKTAGLWISDDPVFSAQTPVSSEKVRILLFGSALSNDEMKEWEVGFASLRKDQSRLFWCDLRLSQADCKKSCSLIVSPFENSGNEGKIIELATRYGFNQCIIIDRDGHEKVLSSSVSDKDSAPRILRIVHQFVDEKDLPAVVYLAQEGGLGGAGDTACVRGLIGAFPVFVESRIETSTRWMRAAEYMGTKGFPRLKEWFTVCQKSPVHLMKMMSSELIEEWLSFRGRAISELDISPWVDRYVHRCVFASGQNGDAIRSVEKAYLEGRLSYAGYASQIQCLTESSFADFS